MQHFMVEIDKQGQPTGIPVKVETLYELVGQLGGKTAILVTLWGSDCSLTFLDGTGRAVTEPQNHEVRKMMREHFGQ